MPATPPRARIWAATFAIYIFWGSAYLAMEFAMQSLPPLTIAGTRLVLAGLALMGFAAARGARLQRQNWAPALVTGAMLFLAGHGLLYWGMQRLNSGLAAVLFASIPLWIVLFERAFTGVPRLGAPILGGLLLGLLGVVCLAGPNRILGGGRVDTLGAAAVVGASIFWSLGSVYCTRPRIRAALPRSGAMMAGLEMLLGGALLLVAARLRGEFHQIAGHAISPRSLWAFAYLVGCSSMIGFSCYLWLLQASTPSRVATYAYINPVVAVVLGWAVAGEAIGARTLAASAMLVGAVVLIVRAQAASGDPLLAAETESQGAIAG